MYVKLYSDCVVFLFRFGRKKTVIGHFILGGLACVIVSLIPGGTNRTGKE